MPNLVVILLHTPWWVFALFALVLWFGLQALRPRVLPAWRLLIIPAVFISWGFASLLARASPWLMADWLLAAAVGGLLARLSARTGEVRISEAGVEVPGSALPLIRNMAIFAAKYTLTAAIAIAPAHRADFAAWGGAVSGISAGYVLAWLAGFALAYRHARQAEPVAQLH